MQCKSIILIALALISANALAQSEQPEKKFRFGNKIGFNMTSLSDVDVKIGDEEFHLEGGRVSFAWHAGVYANYAFSDLLGVQMEAVFSVQGGKHDSWSPVKRNYVNFPILLDIKPFKRRVPISILAGVQFGFCFSEAYEGTHGTELIDNESFSFLNTPLNNDYALVLGAQYTFNKHLTLGLRYNFGLGSTRRTYYAEREPYLVHTSYEGYRFVNYRAVSPIATNRVLQLSLGWTF